MVKTIRLLFIAILVIAAGLGAYAGKAWFDAGQDAPKLRTRADELIRNGYSSADLNTATEDRLAWLLRVQDPAFYTHSGVDIKTAGAGLTTVTQSLSKRIAFAEFHGGLPKIRQTVYAMRLERVLSKEQILALFLDTVPMGKGTDGWMIGFFHTSQTVFNAPPSEIAKDDFLKLLAVMIAPSQFDLGKQDAALTERKRRIGRLLAGKCIPENNADVWLEGCA